MGKNEGMRYINRSFWVWVGRFYYPLCQVGCCSLGRVFSYRKGKLSMFFIAFIFVILDIVTSVIFWHIHK